MRVLAPQRLRCNIAVNTSTTDAPIGTPMSQSHYPAEVNAGVVSPARLVPVFGYLVSLARQLPLECAVMPFTFRKQWVEAYPLIRGGLARGALDWATAKWREVVSEWPRRRAWGCGGAGPGSWGSRGNLESIGQELVRSVLGRVRTLQLVASKT